MGRVIIIMIILLSSSYAEAAIAICFNSARELGSQFYYDPSVDPSQVSDPNCSFLTKPTTPEEQTTFNAQKVLIQSTIRGAPAPKYLKISNGLAVEMTTIEKDNVDTFLADRATTRATYTTELSTQDLCSSANLAEVETKVDNFFNASAANMTTAVNAITAENTVANITRVKSAVTTVATEQSQLRVAFKKLLRCVVSLKKVSGR